MARAIPVWDVTKVDDFISIGMTLHKVTDTKGFLIHLPCVSFYLPQTDVHLFSPQAHHQLWWVFQGLLWLHQYAVENLQIQIQIVREELNLSFVFDLNVSATTRRHWLPQQALAYATPISMLLISLRQLSSRSSNMCTLGSPVHNLYFQWSVCWHYQECKPICTSEGTSPLALDIGHYHVLHPRDDVWAALCEA